jgi:hypothetical protein
MRVDAEEGEDARHFSVTSSIASFVVRQWHGDLRLAVSWWGAGVLVYAFGGFVFNLLVLLMIDALLGPVPLLAVLFYLLLLAFEMMFGAWALMGIWRSSQKHQSNWSILAKVGLLPLTFIFARRMLVTFAFVAWALR